MKQQDDKKQQDETFLLFKLLKQIQIKSYSDLNPFHKYLRSHEKHIRGLFESQLKKFLYLIEEP